MAPGTRFKAWVKLRYFMRILEDFMRFYRILEDFMRILEVYVTFICVYLGEK
jgi:hypothetical protein